MKDRLKAIGGWFADVPVAPLEVGGARRLDRDLHRDRPAAGSSRTPRNDPADYLLANAESVRRSRSSRSFLGDISEAITVFNREGGLTDSDREAIEQTQAAINSDPPEGVGETGLLDLLRG